MKTIRNHLTTFLAGLGTLIGLLLLGAFYVYFEPAEPSDVKETSDIQKTGSTTFETKNHRPIQKRKKTDSSPVKRMKKSRNTRSVQPSLASPDTFEETNKELPDGPPQNWEYDAEPPATGMNRLDQPPESSRTKEIPKPDGMKK